MENPATQRGITGGEGKSGWFKNRETALTPQPPLPKVGEGASRTGSYYPNVEPIEQSRKTL